MKHLFIYIFFFDFLLIRTPKLPNATVGPVFTSILLVLSKTFLRLLLSMNGAFAHFLPLTPTNFPRISHRGFFLPRIPKYRKGDRFSNWYDDTPTLPSFVLPARRNISRMGHGHRDC